MTEMARRRDATQQTLDLYRSRKFSWGDDDTPMVCAHLLHDHLKHMGHEPPPVPDFKGEAGAVRALKRFGANDLTELLDGLLPRRPSPAFMRVGDVALAPVEEGVTLGGLLICAGPFKLLGWMQDHGDFAVIDVDISTLIGVWEA